MALSSEDRKALKQKAHSLKPVILTGSKGLTDAVHLEIARALHDHELIKMKISAEDKAAREAMINEVLTRHEAELVQLIGHMATLYKQKAE